MPFAAGAVAIITVLIYNPGAVPERTLVRAQRVAEAIFAHAGVALNWRPARAADAVPAGSELPIHLLAWRPARPLPNAQGYAVLHPEAVEESYAGVFYPAVVDTANDLDAEVPVVLGASLAHELGHLLLGRSAHATAGVMSARLGAREISTAARGELRFTPGEAAAIRGAALRRSR